LGEGFGLTGQAMAGGGGLLNHGGVLLRHLIHLVDGGIDLGEAGGLFLGGGGDITHQPVQPFHLLDDAGQGLAGFADQPHPAIDLLPGCRDQGLDLLRGIGGTLGERPHLGRDNGEAAPGIAGARGLDAGIEREKIGLEGDLIDDADDIADLAG
jgi:hypothetical protein